MIYAIVGKPGSGKSYLLVKLAKEFLEKGIDVYSNVLIDVNKLNLKPKKRWMFSDRTFLGKCYFWDSLSQFRFISNGVVLFDEAGAYFEPREWAKFNPQDRVKFQQHRKQKLDIYLAVQNFSRVDAVIRQLTNIVYEVHKFFGLFWYGQYDPDEIDLKKRKCFGRTFYFFDKKLANCYDTFQMVNLKEKSEYNFKLMTDFFIKK